MGLPKSDPEPDSDAECIGQPRNRIARHRHRHRNRDRTRKEQQPLSFLKDIVFGIRTLARSPGFAAAAVLALALGIGANTAVFSIVEAIVFFPIPVDDAQRVVFVFSTKLDEGIEQGPTSTDDFLDWRERSRSFENLVAATGRSYNLTGDFRARRLTGFTGTHGFFEMTGWPFALGRPFDSRDASPGAPKVVVLSHGFWTEQFGANPEVLGQTVLLDKQPHTVIGVTAEDFFFPQPDTLLWTPLILERGKAPRDDRNWIIFGRLREGVSAAEAQAEMESIVQGIGEAFPATHQGWGVEVISVRDNLMRGTSLSLIILYCSITLVLLIACANVGSLLLARAAVRGPEMALRSTLGAGRFRLVRQLLIESLVLASAGGLLGFLLGAWGIGKLRQMLLVDANVGFLAQYIELNSTVLVHTAFVSVLTGVLFGTAPALQISKSNLQTILQAGGRGARGSRQRAVLRSGLLVGQIALALALLGSAGALIRTFQHFYTADPAFNPEHLVTFRISLPEEDYSAEQTQEFFREARDRLAALPGAGSATVTSNLPLTIFPGTLTARLQPEGSEEADSTSPNSLHIVTGPGFSETLETSLLRGRGLELTDRGDSIPVALVTQSLMERFWPREEALGKRFRIRAGPMETSWITVVGVVENLQSRMHSLRNPQTPAPTVFLPHSQHSRRSLFLVMRTESDPAGQFSPVRQVIDEMDPTLPLEDLSTMEDVIHRIDAQNTFFLRVVSGLAVIALILAGVGVYGLVSYSVNQRRREIGIRMALGARPHNIVLLVVRQVALLTVIGLPLGLLMALGLIRFLGSQLQGIDASNASGVGTFLGICLVLLAIAHLASALPARRAVLLDPVETLRGD